MRISEWRIQPAGTRRGGGTGVLARTGSPLRVEDGSRTRFLRVPGRFWRPRPRQGQERTDIPQLFPTLATISGSGEGLFGGTGKGGERTFDLFRTGPPRGIIVPGQLSCPLEPRLTWREEVPQEPKAPPCTLQLPTVRVGRAHTPHIPRPPLLTFHTLSPPSVFVFLRFLGSSVPTLLLYLL